MREEHARSCARCVSPLRAEARYCIQCGLQVAANASVGGDRRAPTPQAARRPELILTISREDAAAEKPQKPAPVKLAPVEPAPSSQTLESNEPSLGRRVEDATFAPSFIKELRTWASSPRYLEGQMKLILGDETPSGWIARGLMDDCSDSDRPAPIIGWVVCNQRRVFTPGWSRRGEPYLLVNVERERECAGTLSVYFGSYAAEQSVGELERAAMQPLLQDMLFDRMRYGDVELRIWRLAWIPMWQHVVYTRNRELAGFLLGSVNRISSSSIVEVYESVVVRSGNENSVVLSREDFETYQRQAGAGGLSIVGWWHSHPTQGIALSRLDSKKHFELFPAEYGAHSVAVVVTPHARRRSMRAGVFLPIPRTVTPIIGAELASRVLSDDEMYRSENIDFEDDWAISMVPRDARPRGRTLLIDGLIKNLIDAAPVPTNVELSTARALAPTASRLPLFWASLGALLITLFLIRSAVVTNALSSARDRIQHNFASWSARSKGTPTEQARSVKSNVQSEPIANSKPAENIPSGDRRDSKSGSSHKSSKSESHSKNAAKETTKETSKEAAKETPKEVSKEKPKETKQEGTATPPTRARQLLACFLLDKRGKRIPDRELATEAKLGDYSLDCENRAGVELMNCCQASVYTATQHVQPKLLEAGKNSQTWKSLLSKWRVGRNCKEETPLPKQSMGDDGTHEAVVMLQCLVPETRHWGE